MFLEDIEITSIQYQDIVIDSRILTFSCEVATKPMSIWKLEIVFATHAIRESGDAVQLKLVKFKTEVAHPRVCSFNHVHAKSIRLIGPGIIWRHYPRRIATQHMVTFVCWKFKQHNHIHTLHITQTQILTI